MKFLGYKVSAFHGEFGFVDTYTPHEAGIPLSRCLDACKEFVSEREIYDLSEVTFYEIFEDKYGEVDRVFFQQ